jgi:DNA-binding NarL/FixJ family response regulator
MQSSIAFEGAIMEQACTQALLRVLTPREKQVMDHLAAGQANKVIAIDLGISMRTVEAHRARIFHKLGVRNALQLACVLCAHRRSGGSPILQAIGRGELI